MSFYNPESGESLDVARESMYRRQYTVRRSLEIAKQNPLVQRRVEQAAVPVEIPHTETPVSYATFGRSAVEQADTGNRLEDAQQELERIYGDQEAA